MTDMARILREEHANVFNPCVDALLLFEQSALVGPRWIWGYLPC